MSAILLIWCEIASPSARGAFFGCYGGHEVPQFFLPELGPQLKVPEYDW